MPKGNRLPERFKQKQGRKDTKTFFFLKNLEMRKFCCIFAASLLFKFYVSSCRSNIRYQVSSIKFQVSGFRFQGANENNHQNTI